jgi:hypothetical protein
MDPETVAYFGTGVAVLLLVVLAYVLDPKHRQPEDGMPDEDDVYSVEARYYDTRECVLITLKSGEKYLGRPGVWKDCQTCGPVSFRMAAFLDDVADSWTLSGEQR